MFRGEERDWRSPIAGTSLDGQQSRRVRSSRFGDENAEDVSSVDPAVQIDFNQVAVSSLAKRAGVLADSAPLPFKHTWDLVPYIGTNVSDAWVAPDGGQLHCPW